MKDITVILTSVGGIIGPNHIDCLRAVKERDIKIVGVDASSDNAGAFLVDRFEKIPFVSSEDAYIKKMLQISKESKVDVIVPASDPEVLLLSKNRDSFKNIGTKIVCSGYESAKIASDKYLFSKKLIENNLPAPELYNAKTLEEFKNAAKKLGYPEKPVVMKPRFGTNGGRGVRILDDKKNRKDILFNEKPDDNVYSRMEDIEDMLQGENFPELVISEYLSKGGEYDVDILTRNGEMLVCSPKLRIKKIVGLSLYAFIDNNKEVEDVCRKICKLFKFDYNINIELKRSGDGRIMPFEINPRIAATISLPAAAGANLVYFGIKLALGENLPKIELENKTKIFRHLQGVFVRGEARISKIKNN